MRIVAMAFTGIISLMAIAATAVVGPSAMAAPETKPVASAPACPPGSYWISEGYAHGGTWAPGRCSRTGQIPNVNAGSSTKPLAGADACAPGSHLVPDSYVDGGKFRPAHCILN